jgi:hypothetical protein
MSSKKPEGFKLFVPKDADPEKDMPAKLEVVDYNPARSKKTPLGGGAYDPYERTAEEGGDTARMRRPRVDLRKLSEWIKTTQQVKVLRIEEAEAQAEAEAGRKQKDDEG